MRANFPGFGTDARGQRPCRCFQLRGPRTKVHGPVRLQNVRLYLSQSFRGQVHRGQVELMSREPRTPADNGGHCPFFDFLNLFSAAFFKLICFPAHIILAVVTPVSSPEKPR